MAQVSHATARILELVKPQNTATLIIGHVTKEGNLAGPRTLEHMVDAVFYLEGERFAQLRILRCVKNRFGSTNQVAVFEMKGNGLFTVENPSALFLTEQNKNRAGTAVACTVEGSRALLLEIQALVAHSEYNYPKRNATGFDQNRLQLIIAVLERNLGLKLSDKDIYVAVAGGFRINEPACDLAVAAAIISSLKNVAVGDQVFVGEIGLSGEVRQVGNIEKRLQEAEKLGFKKINTPQGGSGVNKVAELRDLVKLFA
jgi:DNA repair protein RadA/Sms